MNTDGELSMVQSKKNANQGFFNYADNFTYNTAGAMTKMQFGNGRWETAAYNNRLQITQIGLGTLDTAQDLLKLEYSYGTNSQNNGSLREQKITVPTVGVNPGFTATQTYAYDDLNRLQSATEMISSQTWKQTFQYDRYGNRRFDAANTTTLGSCSQAVCNPLINTSDNRFSSGQGYLYDKTGNVTNDANGQQYFYDAENHQKEVKNASGVSLGQYFYDGEGKRVKKITTTETTVFVYNGGGQLVAEYSTTVAPVSTAQVSYLTQDHLGSPRIITDRDGKVISRKDYSAFGEETITAQRAIELGYTSQDEIRKGYTGYEKDGESGLDFAQARYYNSAHGRFTSVDPLTASVSIRDPQTFNRYSYVLNNPLNLTDPLGLAPFWAYRDVPLEDGRTGRQFQYFNNQEEFETYNALYPGFQQWTGGNFYLYDGRLGLALGEGGRSQYFSLDHYPEAKWNELVLAQESGGGFNEDQRYLLGATFADHLRNSEEGQQAIDNTLNIVTLGIAGTERRATRAVLTSAENRLASILGRNGGTAVEGGFQFGTRRAARQAASEFAGDLGSEVRTIRAFQFEGGPWWMKNSNRVIGRQSFDRSRGWRDDFLGHPQFNMGSHVNVWNNGSKFHLFYPSK